LGVESRGKASKGLEITVGWRRLADAFNGGKERETSATVLAAGEPSTAPWRLVNLRRVAATTKGDLRAAAAAVLAISSYSSYSN